MSTVTERITRIIQDAASTLALSDLDRLTDASFLTVAAHDIAEATVKHAETDEILAEVIAQTIGQ